MQSFRNTSNKTIAQTIRARIEAGKLVLSLIWAGLFTAFSVVMLYKRWGKSVYLYIILSFVFLYILLSVVLITIIRLKGGRLKNSVKNYQSGLTILKSFLAIINFGLTVSIFSVTLFSDANTFFYAAVLVVSLIWAVFQIVYQIIKVLRRYNVFRRKKRTAAGLRLAKKKELSERKNKP